MNKRSKVTKAVRFFNSKDITHHVLKESPLFRERKRARERESEQERD